jgi:hypothetical protein
MTVARNRNIGLTLLAILLVALLGAAIWQGSKVPDPKSCLARASRLIIHGQDHPGESAEIGRLCRNPRSVS